jgi:hypothetical protein
MTPLRQRMIEDMQLRGLSARTQGSYVTASLARPGARSPRVDGPVYLVVRSETHSAKKATGRRNTTFSADARSRPDTAAGSARRCRVRGTYIRFLAGVDRDREMPRFPTSTSSGSVMFGDA